MSEIEPISAKTMELAGQIVEIARSENVRRGDRLYEHRLANRLGVSRGPVRAALRSLAQSGLAEAVPNKGFVLAQDLDSEIALRALRAGDTSEAAYLAIANDRLTGALPDTVSEAELMRRYDLKRAELLRLLDRIASEGWVERLRGYGWKFTQTLNSPLAYAQTGRLRMMIEPGGILEPTFQWNAELMGPVREHQKRVQADGMRVFTLSEMFRFGCEVHEAIAECSGNAFLLGRFDASIVFAASSPTSSSLTSRWSNSTRASICSCSTCWKKATALRPPRSCAPTSFGAEAAIRSPELQLARRPQARPPIANGEMASGEWRGEVSIRYSPLATRYSPVPRLSPFKASRRAKTRVTSARLSVPQAQSGTRAKARLWPSGVRL